MNSRDIISLGLGLEEPWKITGQILDTAKVPHELRLTIGADRGSLYPCPVCGRLSKAHDFKELTWRHLNFFQHHCLITAKVPRVCCEEHGIRQIEVPWARKGSRFTLLFEQAAMVFVREMPVLAAARIMGISDTRLWRIVLHYVNKAIAGLDLGGLKAFGMDETSARRGHRYVTVFIDLDRKERPVVFATPGKGKDTLEAFKKFLSGHGGRAENILEVVSDMSGAFISGVRMHFVNKYPYGGLVPCGPAVHQGGRGGKEGRGQGGLHAQGQPMGRSQVQGSSDREGMEDKGTALLGPSGPDRKGRQTATDLFFESCQGMDLRRKTPCSPYPSRNSSNSTRNDEEPKIQKLLL